jgi:hypothetical protein
MKRTFLFLLAAVLLGAGLQSCNKDDNNGDNNGGNNGGGSGGSTTPEGWVDLGLPSGLLWADRNVGAENPEDYGNYYAWGEIAPKDVYNWSTYAYGNAAHELTKYCSNSEYGLNGFTDSLTTLEPSDDAATVNIGGGARTPTKDEWQELMDNTTSTWTTQNGVYGRLLTGSNGKSLFLPAAGIRFSSSPDYAGKYGFYWSSALSMDCPSDAWYVGFGSGRQDVDYSYRDDGFSVRAVRAR